MDIVEKVKPWRTILTHFSSRYQKVGEILPRHKDLKVMIAFDHMRLEVKEFEWAY